MQTHIVIRAPRWFAHPAWIPCQNVTALLEVDLHEFLNESLQRKVIGVVSNKNPRSVKQKKGRPEGIWLTCCDGINLDLTLPQDALEQGPNIAEDDEMIWWSWDRKLVRFSDWWIGECYPPIWLLIGNSISTAPTFLMSIRSMGSLDLLEEHFRITASIVFMSFHYESLWISSKCSWISSWPSWGKIHIHPEFQLSRVMNGDSESCTIFVGLLIFHT